MKKLFAVIIAMAMLLSAAAFAEITGTWNLSEAVMNGTSMSPADMGIQITIVLNEDNSAVMSSNISEDGDKTGTWSLDGETLTITTDGEAPSTLTYADDKLVMDMGDEGSMVFTQGEVEAPYVPAAANTAAAVEDFAGKWQAVKVGMEGKYFPAEMLNQAFGGEYDPFTAEINGTSIKIAGFMFGSALPELPATFADGVLKIEVEGQFSIACQLLEDGAMSMAMSAGGQSFEFIMTKAE